ncbi:hypothetical protein EFY87_18680 [Flexivirga caeni]|uniref:Uncharacterized protein n=1 Tax=Flexivirga caeni TaxID=2294115 RepID=A0A3M9LXN6_9MICO|nr:hypothetical protein EFY87_18680 [Flexivirga caeni]
MPSPHLFARPTSPHAAHASDAQPARSPQPVGTQGTDSRFAATGDERVDQALAALPDPSAHEREAADRESPSGTDGFAPEEESAPAIGGRLPDPALLDQHIADVTAVHRQLQQRLSDLSG